MAPYDLELGPLEEPLAGPLSFNFSLGGTRSRTTALSVYPVSVDYHRPLDAMIAAGNYNYVDSRITSPAGSIRVSVRSQSGWNFSRSATLSSRVTCSTS